MLEGAAGCNFWRNVRRNLFVVSRGPRQMALQLSKTDLD